MSDDRAALIECQIPGLRRFAQALLRGDRERADDLVQDSLERALVHWHGLRSEENCQSWLYTIIHNRFATEERLRRRRNVHVHLSDVGEAELPVSDGGPYAALQYRDFLRAFQKLPEAQRSVLLLAAVEGLSYQEVSRALAVPIGTVMSRLSRARERLRRTMNGEDHAGDARLWNGVVKGISRKPHPAFCCRSAPILSSRHRQHVPRLAALAANTEPQRSLSGAVRQREMRHGKVRSDTADRQPVPLADVPGAAAHPFIKEGQTRKDKPA